MSVDEFIKKVTVRDREFNIVFSSGKSEEQVAKYLNESCAYRFIAKPYDLSELKRVLDHSECEKRRT